MRFAIIVTNAANGVSMLYVLLLFGLFLLFDYSYGATATVSIEDNFLRGEKYQVSVVDVIIKIYRASKKRTRSLVEKKYSFVSLLFCVVSSSLHHFRSRLLDVECFAVHSFKVEATTTALILLGYFGFQFNRACLKNSMGTKKLL